MCGYWLILPLYWLEWTGNYFAAPWQKSVAQVVHRTYWACQRRIRNGCNNNCPPMPFIPTTMEYLLDVFRLCKITVGAPGPERKRGKQASECNLNILLLICNPNVRIMCAKTIFPNTTRPKQEHIMNSNLSHIKAASQTDSYFFHVTRRPRRCRFSFPLHQISRFGHGSLHLIRTHNLTTFHF